MNISQNEKIILQNLPTEYKWIARDKNGELNIYKTKPIKATKLEYWESDNYKSFDIFSHLYEDIVWEDKEPYKISSLIGEEEI